MPIHHTEHGPRDVFGVELRARREVALDEGEEILDVPESAAATLARSALPSADR